MFHSACTNFAASEGRNPWVKNAFLALSNVTKSAKFQKEGEDKEYAHSVMYMYAYSPALYFAKCIQTAWGICSSVHFLNGVCRYQ